MADFKIKSAAGTGNKTLIQGQDQSGSAYAIQVNDAGATTLTNATITAGTFPIKVKMGQYQWDQGLASGSRSVTGVGFQGNYMEGWVNYTASTSITLRSFGSAKIVGSTITQQCTQFPNDAATSVLSNYFASTSDDTSGTDDNYQKLALTSFDSDGFSFTNTLVATGSPSGMHAFTYVVYYLGTMS